MFLFGRLMNGDGDLLIIGLISGVRGGVRESASNRACCRVIIDDGSIFGLGLFGAREILFDGPASSRGIGLSGVNIFGGIDGLPLVESNDLFGINISRGGG